MEIGFGCENSVMNGGKVNDFVLGNVSGGEQQGGLGQNRGTDLLNRILEMM
jgi:hypothetical protein